MIIKNEKKMGKVLSVNRKVRNVKTTRLKIVFTTKRTLEGSLCNPIPYKALPTTAELFNNIDPCVLSSKSLKHISSYDLGLTNGRFLLKQLHRRSKSFLIAQ